MKTSAKKQTIAAIREKIANMQIDKKIALANLRDSWDARIAAQRDRLATVRAEA